MREQAQGAGIVAASQFALKPFTLHRPRTAHEAFEIWRGEPGAVLLAGSTDIIARMRDGVSPEAVLSLSGLTEWKDVVRGADSLRLGALMTHQTGPADPVLRDTLPALGDAWARIANVRIRARATLGGNIMARRYRYEMPVMLASLDAELELHGSRGEFRVKSTDLWEAPSPTGVLHHVSVPLAGLKLFSYERTLRPLLTVALAVRTRSDEFRLTATVGSEYCSPVTVRHDVASLDDLRFEQIGRDLACQLPDYIGDRTATASYKRRVVAVLIRRQLVEARRIADGPSHVL